MNYSSRTATWLGLLFLGAALALWALPKEEDPVGQENEALGRSLPVRVALAELEDPSRLVRFAGVTQPRDHAVLAFAVPGRVENRAVEVGDSVTADAVLARLDSREYQNAVSLARASLAELEARWRQAQKDVERAQELRDLNAATLEELEQVEAGARAVEAGRDAAVARLREAQRLLDEASLRAPFAGIVTAVYLEAGEWANPGLPVLELSGSSGLEVEVELPESVVWTLEKGRRVEVELPFHGGGSVYGQVSSLSRASAGPGRLFPVIVELPPSQDLWAGMTAEVLVEVTEAASLTVPFGAVVNPGSSNPSVFCIRDGTARQIHVSLGALTGDRIAVEGPLDAGDLVVVAGHTRLADGDGVEILAEERS